MSVDILKLKTLAEAAKRDQYDCLVLNDYGMAVPPAVVLELITEIERHRLEAEGCKPELVNDHAGHSTADVTVEHTLAKAEGGTPDHDIHPGMHLDKCISDSQLIEWLDQRGTIWSDPETTEIRFPHTESETGEYTHVREALIEAYRQDTLERGYL
ncbi:hypothetical protein LOY37_18310 [Pseudomonas sp. B21-012]|uniref:hypothetical protein n=1 Tax=unclassified Pseudomonas TaxID=196821 RepID=UPI001BD0F1ED|nr:MULTISPECIES: hypothetical protein [unclassified Pseudomonas]QVM98370.1 hypothetical protein JYG36_09440 [Pseudomonas sp. SORT22]UVM54304.1 hypothetical protein LOY37_18310 [Pseudomonas sp. B21-012]